MRRLWNGDEDTRLLEAEPHVRKQWCHGLHADPASGGKYFPVSGRNLSNSVPSMRSAPVNGYRVLSVFTVEDVDIVKGGAA
jgi:hypothetical protein